MTMGAKAASREDVRSIPLRLIERNPDQHRKHFDQATLEELAASIVSRGILQNLVVRPHPRHRGKYEIIAGERRYRAAQLAGLKEVPCRVIQADDAEAYRMSLVENVQRADITALEEADAYATLRDRYGLTSRAIADAVGKSEQYVNHKLQLTRLGATARRLVAEGHLSPLAGYFIARIPDHEQQARVALAVVQRDLSDREANQMVNLLLDGETGDGGQELLFEVQALSAEEQQHRTRFVTILDRVTIMLHSAWDVKQQQISRKVLRNAVQSDLDKVRNLRKWLGDIETDLSTELQRRNLQETA
jgi:ParB/RepB/Spo0J family partition protein